MEEYKDLHMLPRLELARELSDRLYGNIPRRFRELVSNAVDAGATQVKINIDTEKDFISVVDNGLGMSPKILQEEFLSLGGSHKKARVDKIGRIGVGFLALASLGSRIKIKSGFKGKSGFQAEIYFEKILDESIRRKLMHEEVIGNFVEINNIANNGTEIIISNLRPNTKEYLLNNYSMFIKELMRILPLEYNPASKIFTKLSKKFQDFLLTPKNDLGLPTCQVIINGCELKRYCFGDTAEEQIIAIKEFDFSFKGNSGNLIKVIGYAIDAGELVPKEQQGFISRVKNVAVEEKGFLGMNAGAQSQRVRVTGEIHILGLDENIGINLDRTSFNYDLPDLQLICTKLDSELKKFFLEVRDRSSEHSKANKVRNVVKAFQSLTKDISKTLEKHQDIDQTSTIQDINTLTPLPKKSMKDIIVEAGAQPSLEKDIKVQYEGESWVTKIPSNILNTIGRLTVLGIDYEICFSNLGFNHEPCKIINRQICYNLDHPIVSNNLYTSDYTLFKLLFCLAYAYNKNIGKSAGDMYCEVVKLLEDVMNSEK